MTNLLLFLILIVLLFGAGSILGLFNTVFWLVLGILFVVVVWKASKYVIEDEIKQVKEAYDKHIIITPLFWILAVFFIVLVIFFYFSQSSSEVKPIDNSGVKVTPLTNKYPSNVRVSFFDSCYKNTSTLDIESGLVTEYCKCTLNYIESRYSLTEYAQAEAQYMNSGQLPTFMTDSATYCAKELSNERI